MKEKSIKQHSEAFYNGTLTAYKTVNKHIVPVITKIKGKNDAEKAIIGAFFRAHACMHSMSKLDDILDFQVVASCARTIFEILVDIKLLSLDSTGKLAVKYHLFPTIEKFNSAQKINRFWEKYKTDLGDCFNEQRDLVKSFKKKIDKAVKQKWGINKKNKPYYPRHWTGKNLECRVRELSLKYKIYYYKLYPTLSWFVHSGSACYDGFDEEDFFAAFGLAHSIALDSYLEALTICVEFVELENTIDSFSIMIEELRKTPEIFHGEK